MTKKRVSYKRITFTLTEEDRDIEAFLNIAKSKKGRVIKRAIRYYIINSRKNLKDSAVKEFLFENIEDEDIDLILTKICNSLKGGSESSEDLLYQEIQEPVLEKAVKPEIKKEMLTTKTEETSETADSTGFIEDNVNDDEDEDWLKASVGDLLSGLSNV